MKNNADEEIIAYSAEQKDVETIESVSQLPSPIPEAPKRYKPTPLPLYQMVPMAFVLLSDSLCATILSPFIGLFVAHLEKRPSDEAGYISGLLLFMFMIGQVMSAKTWGWMSDKYGRRPPLICGLFSSGVAMLGFGLSTKVWQCAIFRLLQGIFNGNILVAKTMMADITNKTNEARGFAFVSLCFGIGNLIGPGVGGLLYNPVDSLSFLNLSPDGVFGRNPALLPCLVIFIYSMIGITICILFVRESNAHAQPLPGFIRILPCFWREAPKLVLPPLIEIDEEGSEIVIVDLHESVSDDQAEEYQLSRISSNIIGETDIDSVDVRQTSDIRSEHISKSVSVEAETNVLGSSSSPEEEGIGSEEDKSRNFGYKEAFGMPVTRFMLITYMVLCGSDTLCRECLSLWGISSSEKGGLNLDAQKVGFILLMNSFPLFIANFAFAKACSRYQNKMALFRLGVLCAGIGVFCMPLTIYVSSGGFCIFLVLICSSVRQFFCTWSYSLNTMFTARAAPPGKVGAIMGVNQSCNALTRGLVPLIGSPLFAWSISGYHIFPFDHVLVFFLSSFGFWYCAVRSYEVRTRADSSALEIDNVSVLDVLKAKWSRLSQLLGFS